MPDDGTWLVRWHSAFDDGQTTYSMFPSDTRQRLRNAYYQWDDAQVPDSLLTIDEVTSWGNTDHETHPLNFRSLRMEDVPGMYRKVLKSGSSREVEWAVSWLNSDWNWITEKNDWEARKADVQTVQVHEFGHATGFGHPCVPGPGENDCDPTTVMAYIKNGTKRTLTDHDKEAMADKY